MTDKSKNNNMNTQWKSNEEIGKFLLESSEKLRKLPLNTWKKPKLIKSKTYKQK